MRRIGEMAKLRALMESAYKAGFRRGNSLDSGCSPDDFSRFDDWLDEVGGGEIVSALADLATTPSPYSMSDGLVVIDEQEFLIIEVSRGLRNRDGDETLLVTLQDRQSYERENRVGGF